MEPCIEEDAIVVWSKREQDASATDCSETLQSRGENDASPRCRPWLQPRVEAELMEGILGLKERAGQKRLGCRVRAGFLCSRKNEQRKAGRAVSPWPPENGVRNGMSFVDGYVAQGRSMHAPIAAVAPCQWVAPYRSGRSGVPRPSAAASSF